MSAVGVRLVWNEWDVIGRNVGWIMVIILNISIWSERGSITWLDIPLGVLLSFSLGSRILEAPWKLGMSHQFGNLTVNSSVKCDPRKRVYSLVISVIHTYNKMQFLLLYAFLQCRYSVGVLFFLWICISIFILMWIWEFVFSFLHSINKQAYDSSTVPVGISRSITFLKRLWFFWGYLFYSYMEVKVLSNFLMMLLNG